MLISLWCQDYSLRHSLTQEDDIYQRLIRVCLIKPEDQVRTGALQLVQVRTGALQLVDLLLFVRVASTEIGNGETERPGTRFSLPSQVIKWYQLPVSSQPRSLHIAWPSPPLCFHSHLCVCVCLFAVKKKLKK